MIKMKINTKGSNFGNIIDLENDKEYSDLDPSLVEVLLNAGLADDFTTKVAPEPEKKVEVLAKKTKK